MSSFSSLLLFFFFPCKFPDIFLISRPRCNKRATQVSNNFSYQNFRIIRLFLYRETRLSRCNKIQVVIVSISIIFWFLIYIKTYDYYFLIFIKKLSYASVQQIQNYSDFSYQNPHQNRFWRTYCSKTSRSGNRIDSTFLIPDYYIILSIKTCLIIFLKKKKSSITLIQNPTIFISDDLSLDAVKNRFYFSQISDPWFIFQLRPNSTFSVKIRTIFISIKNILRYPNPSSFPFDKQIFSPKKIPPKIETSLSLSLLKNQQQGGPLFGEGNGGAALEDVNWDSSNRQCKPSACTGIVCASMFIARPTRVMPLCMMSDSIFGAE